MRISFECVCVFFRREKKRILFSYEIFFPMLVFRMVHPSIHSSSCQMKRKISEYLSLLVSFTASNMPVKKKPTVNRTGIYYFADEYRRTHTNGSRKSIHDIILFLLPQWRLMSLVERKPYEEYVPFENENVLMELICML